MFDHSTMRHFKSIDELYTVIGGMGFIIIAAILIPVDAKPEMV